MVDRSHLLPVWVAAVPRRRPVVPVVVAIQPVLADDPHLVPVVPLVALVVPVPAASAAVLAAVAAVAAALLVVPAGEARPVRLLLADVAAFPDDARPSVELVVGVAILKSSSQPNSPRTSRRRHRYPTAKS